MPESSAMVTASPPKKRLAVFLDGTWNTVNDNTNVWRLKAVCAQRGADGLDQLTYYDQGLGTGWGERFFGGAFGVGINTNVIDAYKWIMENYSPGDDIFIFGFSRGAYSARSLSGLLSKCGLIKLGAPLSIKQLYKRYRLGSKAKTLWTLLDEKEKGQRTSCVEEQWIIECSSPIRIKFIGVWDTVGALGIPNVPWTNWADMQFLNTGIRRTNDFAFHALAIDEHRKSFAPTLWTKTIKKGVPEDPPPRELSEVEQRWFVGAHANVGGGCESDLLPQSPLTWIAKKAALHGLNLGGEVDVAGDANSAPIADSFAEFLGGAYRVYRLNRRFYRGIGEPPTETDTELTYVINETIDRSVFERWRDDPKKYRPPALVAWGKRHKVDVGGIQSSVRADDPKVAVSD
jgi:uncharacterized protein (DUF2235 family)